MKKNKNILILLGILFCPIAYANNTPFEMDLNNPEKKFTHDFKDTKMKEDFRPEYPLLEKMSEADKILFLNNQISSMEKGLERQYRLIERLKRMSLEEKEAFFSNQRDPMREEHEKMKNICDNLGKNDIQTFSYQKALKNLKESLRYKNSSDEDKIRLEKSLENFENLPHEKKEEIYRRRLHQLNTFCMNRF